jgi:hypothetical protein
MDLQQIVDVAFLGRGHDGEYGREARRGRQDFT